MPERSLCRSRASSSCRRAVDSPPEDRIGNGAVLLREDSVSIRAALFFHIRGATAGPGRRRMKTLGSFFSRFKVRVAHTNRQHPVFLVAGLRVDDSACINTIRLAFGNDDPQGRTMVSNTDRDFIYRRQFWIDRVQRPNRQASMARSFEIQF